MSDVATFKFLIFFWKLSSLIHDRNTSYLDWCLSYYILRTSRNFWDRTLQSFRDYFYL